VGAVARRAHAQVAPFAWRGVQLRYADRTIADGTTLDVGGRSVHAIDVGPTHTAADAIVHVPDAGVAFAADILFIGVAPIMWHGPVETWLAALDTLLSLDAGVYVPGHGPPCGRAEIEELAAYWRWLREAVAEQRAAGRPASEAAKLLVRSPEHARFAAWEGAERIVVNVATMYRNLDGGPAEVKPPVRAKLLVQTVALGQELASG
jgi:glyoxylase-like metal-dependent hydrolase (beta-lactamase superfamily II)